MISFIKDIDMIDTLVEIGEFDVISSGSFPIWGCERVLLTLNPNIKVRLVFSENKDESIIVRSNLVDGVLEYTLTNFNNPLGTEFTSPAEIGTFMGRKLFFHIKVLGNSNADNKTVFYTWLLGGAITDGR